MTRCTSCGGGKFKQSFAVLTRHVSGHAFKATLPGRVCSACGTKFFASSDLAEFDLMVATTLAHSAVADAEALKFMRKTTGLQAKQFAQLLGVRPETVSRWESGKTGIDRATYALLQQLVLDQIEGRPTTQERLRVMMHPRKLPKVIAAEDVTLAEVVDRLSNPNGIAYIEGVKKSHPFLIERLVERRFLKPHPRQIYSVTDSGREFADRVLGRRAA
jgi:putative zinc finger/helix-turn-helix YgiT family protein